MERKTVFTMDCEGGMLTIEISKQPDHSTLLRCIRADSSITWQKQTKHAAHFVLHDLTHYAVETTLGYRHGFFGLLAQGWDIEDTTGKGAKGSLPPEALVVERIVGLLDSERASSTLWTLAEFNAFAPRTLQAAELELVRASRAALFQKWFALAPGQKLELQFPAVS
jgi:hypothetical protein